MSTEIKIVDGYVADDTNMKKLKVTVRFTHDKYGESISLQADDLMIGAAFEPIEKVIKKARR